MKTDPEVWYSIARSTEGIGRHLLAALRFGARRTRPQQGVRHRNPPVASQWRGREPCRSLRRSPRWRSRLRRGGRHHQRAIGSRQDHAYGSPGACRVRLPHRRGAGHRPGRPASYSRTRRHSPSSAGRGSFSPISGRHRQTCHHASGTWPRRISGPMPSPVATPPSLVLLLTHAGSEGSGGVAGMQEVTSLRGVGRTVPAELRIRGPAARPCASWPTSFRDVRVSTCPPSISTARSEASRRR